MVSGCSRDDFVVAGPAMPEGIAEVVNTPKEEYYAQLNRVPLFMQTIDGAENNVEFEALQAVAYEGEPDEVAENFRQQGNERHQAGSYRDAIEFFTRALAVKCDNQVLHEAVYANRALCNLKLENYGKALDDCTKVLNINPINVKAIYRSALAYKALRRYDAASECLERAFQITGQDQNIVMQMKKLMDELNILRKQQIAQKSALIQIERAEQQEKATIKLALQQRRIATAQTSSQPDMGELKLALSDPLDPSSVLTFPVIFLYPLSGQSDLIQAFAETDPVQDHLNEVLAERPFWDSEHEYISNKVDVYAETADQAHLIKLSKRRRLIDCISGGKVIINDGLLRLIIVPSSKASTWIAQWKSQRCD